MIPRYRHPLTFFSTSSNRIAPNIHPNISRDPNPTSRIHYNSFNQSRSHSISKSNITSSSSCSSRNTAKRNTGTQTTMAEFPPKAIQAIVQEVAALLKERGESVSVAETAAGGIISASILSTPGASGIYKGGLTLYTLPSRIAFAGWTEESIKDYKGPTPQIVSGLAENVRAKLDSTYTLCESGTAGPTGGTTPNRTPGYVALAVATAKGTYTKELSTGLGGDREKNMIAFAVEGLKFLKDVIKGDAKL